MNRRHFISGGAVAVSGLLSTFKAAAQTAPVLALTSTAMLLDPATGPNVAMCQDVILDEKKIITLWRSGPPRSQASSYSQFQFFVTATDASGSRLWSWPLAKGNRYVGLGTRGPAVILLTSGGAAELDPGTGAQTPLVSTDRPVGSRYAGDSKFFRMANGLGEVWSFDGLAFQQQLTGISAQTLTSPAALIECCPGGAMVAASRNGASAAVIDLSNGSVRQTAISSELVANSTTFYSALLSKKYSEAQQQQTFGHLLPAGSTESVSILEGIGGDAQRNIYAIVQVPDPHKAGRAVMRLDQSGVASSIGTAPLPPGETIGSFPVMKLFPIAGSLGIVSGRGRVAWYTLPTA